jgi:hypothetical protein
MWGKRIQNFLSRLIVLLVALHVLDVSVDVDHLTWNTTCNGSAFLDDTDSLSELLVEFFMDDNQYFTEHNKDDHSTSHKATHKCISFIKKVTRRITCDVPSYVEYVANIQSEVSNTIFIQEDFSIPVAPPPKHHPVTA